MNAHQHDSDLIVIRAMQRYGGSFVKALAAAALLADDDNRERIRAAWPEYWKKYQRMAGTGQPAIQEGNDQ